MRLHGSPGQILRGAVRVRDLSGHPVTVILQPADIQNASNGNADYVTTQLSETGRWLHLAALTVRLAAHAARLVTFTVTIPAGATGASHYAGIVAINAAELATAAAHTPTKGQTFSFYRIDRQALPLTIRLPGPLTRSLALRSAEFIVQPIGASLKLALLPAGSELIQSAQINLRILRGTRTIFTYHSTLGQLFPGASLNYRIPWHGRPTPGTYHLLGIIRPNGASPVNINKTVEFTSAKATQLKREIPPAAKPPPTTTPGWMWLALATAAALMITLSLVVFKLARRPAKTPAHRRGKRS